MARSAFATWLKRQAFLRNSPTAGGAGKHRRQLSVEALEERVLMASGLVAAYNFDEGSGTVLHDLSGNNNNGSVTNAAWSSAGKYGGALSFNGSTSLVNVPNATSLQLTKGMTLEAWIDPTTLKSPDNGWSAAISKENRASSANDTSYALYAANGNGTPAAGHVLVNGSDRGVQGNSPVPLNTWTFLTATYDGSTLKMYVNGALVGSKSISGSITTTSDPLRIGGDWSGEMFTGKIDNIRLYNTALSPTAILADMATPVSSQGNPPAVTSVSPPNGATGVATGGSVQVAFNEALDPTTVSAGTVQLLDPSGSAVAASVSYNATTFTATLTPSTALAYSTAYTVLVHGGTTAPVIKEAGGTAMAANFSSSFTTAAQPPAANAGPGQSGKEGSAVAFSGSVTGGQPALSYAWTFGDGGTATGTLTPSHVYADNGSYAVTLTVTDSLGRTSSSSTTATVANVAPTPIPGGPYSGTPGTAIAFSGSATDPSQADTKAGFTYSWSFGDGATGTGAAPTHAYAQAGTYTVTLTATDKDGGSSSVSTTATVSAGSSQPFPNNGNPPPLPPPTGTVINVSTVSQLQSAVANLKSGQTIMVAPGTYTLTGTLYFPQNLTNVAIRGASGKAGDVIIQGDAVISPTAPYSGSAIWGAGSGIAGSIPFGIWLGNVQGVTVGDLTLKNFVDDAIILNAGVQSPLIHDVVMLDTGEQLFKSNPDGSGGGVNNGVIEYSTIGYTVAAPNNYTNGVDIHTGQNWVLRNNLFENIYTTNTKTTLGPGALAGPAVLIWNGSKNATLVANTFVNNQREVAFGLSDPSTITDDNSGGIIANNFLYRSGGQHGDVAIGVWNSPNTEVAYNTVILNGDYPNAVEYRFATTTGVKILYNLTDSAITARDGATATVTGNVTTANPSWFVNAGIGDLHLSSSATGAIGKGQALTEVRTDYDGQARPASGADDVGADQYQAAAPTPPQVTAVAPANGTTGVAPNTTVAVTFNEALDPTTVSAGTVQLLAPSGSAVAATVSYNATTFTATLTPSAALAASTTYTVLVHGGTSGTVIKDTAGDRMAANFSSSFTTATPPVANAGSGKSGNEGSAVTFSGSASGGQGSLSYSWSFGDGGSATGTLTPAHTYADNGTYTVTLLVTDSLGQTSQSSTTATIANVAPTPNPAGPYSGSTGTAIAFSGSAADPSSVDTKAGFTWLWAFGDGTTSTAQSPSHAYAQAGTYTVTLTATDKDGGSSSASTSATISAPTNPPVANAGAKQSGKEGSAVTFSGSVTGGQPALSYSWSFGDGGTASGTLTPSHVYDDNGTYTVTLTVTDSLGRSSQSSTTATVANVAPTPNPGGPYSGTPGAAVAFSGSATDPSQADTKAGLTFSWAFGDGATGTGAAPTHAYAQAGTYTVTLTATDKDGGSASASTSVTVQSGSFDGDPYIVTPYLKIPNFGAKPTDYSVKSGNWSDPSVWSLGRLPAAGDIVDVNPGTTITYDVNDSTNAAALNTLEIQAGGTLTFRTDVNTQLCVGNFLVLPGGSLVVGTAANPVAANVHANIDIANQAINTTTDPQQFGTGLIVLGNVTMHGVTKAPYVTLAAEAHAGDTTLKFAQPVSGWQVGDDIEVPDTRQLDYGGDYGTYKPQMEGLEIKSISADGLTVTLSAPLKYNHLGARDAKGALSFLPQVMNNGRNIMVESANVTGTRGYTMYTARANVDIEYAGFCELGRTTINATSSSNPADRYAMTMLDLIGPTAPQANGYQFTLIGNEVDNDGDGNANNPSNIQWGIALNNSHYGLVQSNNVWAVAGAGIGVEDGASSYNVIDHNFVGNVTGTSNRTDQALQGDAFWFGNPNNYVTNNIATDINGGGWTVYSYGYSIDMTGGNRGSLQAGVTAQVPAFQGADPSVAGQSKTLNMNDVPILQFAGNSVYGATSSGMTVWWLGTFGDNYYSDAQVSVVKNLTAWNIGTRSFYGYPTNNLTIDGMVVRGDPSFASNGFNYTQGINFDDYMTRNLVIQNADIQGVYTGIEAPFMVGRVPTMDTTVIQNSFLSDTVDIELTPPRSVNGSSGLSPQTLNITNVTFAHPSAVPQSWREDLSLAYVSSDSLGTSNMSVPQYVYVYSYNGTAGDNFEAFYSQYAPAGATTRQFVNGKVLKV